MAATDAGIAGVAVVVVIRNVASHLGFQGAHCPKKSFVLRCMVKELSGLHAQNYTLEE